MATKNNPFIVTGKIAPEYFCDRVIESKRLVKTITNGRNLVVISPRRMGKTGLVQYCYDHSEIADNYYTFFIDILHTTSLREFTYLFGREVFATFASKSRKMAMSFVQAIKSISGKFGIDPMTALPTFNLQLGDIDRPEYTLEEIFRYLSEADKPCIVAFDEFQQIAKYPENNIEAILRTHIQKLQNCNFIFAGSERHMMQEMFTVSARPFYLSADILELNAIPMEIYVPFIVGLFESRGRNIMPEIATKVYTLFKGHTYYIQKTFNEAFANTAEGETCTLSVVQAAIEEMIDSSDTLFREILSNIPEKQKSLLYAIALEGECRHITSAVFVRKHNLISASAVQSAVKKLMEKDHVTVVNKVYSLTNKLFALWINKIYGIGIYLPE
ncbi:MAG: ATP-binding protein [Coprobacter sp.]|nr:ATP-binding protein [Coprobacter sp.]